MVMADKGAQTRERILAAAEPLILRQGFAGTSLDDILEPPRLTKGAFFHHFQDKAGFARALIERYARNDSQRWIGFRPKRRRPPPTRSSRRCYSSSRSRISSPACPEPIIGCLFATYTYESLQFEPAINEFIAQSLRRWSALYEKKFEAVLTRYRPAKPTSARELSETIMAVLEGGFILARNFNDPVLVTRLSRQFRQYLELLFADSRRHGQAGQA